MSMQAYYIIIGRNYYFFARVTITANKVIRDDIAQINISREFDFG